MVPDGIPGEGWVGVTVPERVTDDPRDIDPEDNPSDSEDVLRNMAVKLRGEFITKDIEGLLPMFTPPRLQ